MKRQAPATTIPYGRQSLDRADIRSVVQVLRSSFLTQGPVCGQFEKELCGITGAPFAVAVSSGTAALHLAALCLDLKPGDEVITTPMSFLATSNAILYAGAKPVFADIDPETQCLDAGQVQKKITRRTRAIFVTDFAGHPADLKSLSALARRHKLQIVEDAAHALGGMYEGARIGACRYSDLTIFSFHPVKHITTGEGGALTTQHPGMAERLRELRSHGVTRNPARFQGRDSGPWYYEMQDLGYNYRMTDLQAALGRSQLKKLSAFLTRRRKIADRYTRAFRPYPFLATPIERKGARHAYHLYILRLTDPRLVRHRKQIVEDFHAAGIGVQVHYIPIVNQPYYRHLGYRPDEVPEAVRYYESAFSLPLFPALKDREVDFVIRQTPRILEPYLAKER